MLWARVLSNFELGQKLIHILKALLINFHALKVVKWATMLHAAAHPVSVNPSKYGTKRKGSEEVHNSVDAWLSYDIDNSIKLRSMRSKFEFMLVKISSIF